MSELTKIQMLCPSQVEESFETYLGNTDYISSSDLKNMLKSPAHYKASLDAEDEEKDNLKLGTYFHCYILEGNEAFSARYAGLDESKKPEPTKDYRNAKNRDWKAGLEEAAAKKGLELIAPDLYERLINMVNSFRKNAKAMELLNGCEYRETSFYSELEIDGTPLKCRIRPDALSTKGYYISLKSATDASPEAFTLAAHKFGYHISEAFYTQILNKELPKEYRPKNGFIIATENKAPFITQVYEINPNWQNKEISDFLLMGDYEVQRGLNRFKICRETENYPGYQIESEREDGVIPMTVPFFANSKISSKII